MNLKYLINNRFKSIIICSDKGRPAFHTVLMDLWRQYSRLGLPAVTKSDGMTYEQQSWMRIRTLSQWLRKILYLR